MKKFLLTILSIICMVTLALFVVGCDNPEENNNNNNNNPPQQPVEINVTYDYEGKVLRDGVELTSKTEKVEAGYTFPTAEKLGYEFKGWLLNSATITDPTAITASATLTPKFEALIFNVKVLDDTGAVSSHGFTKAYDSAITDAEIDALKAKFTTNFKQAEYFVYVNDGVVSTDKFLATTFKFTNDITIQVVTKEFTNNITIKGNGGKVVVGGENKDTYETTVKLSDGTFSLANISFLPKEDEEFKGWAIEGGSALITSITLEKDVNYVIVPVTNAKLYIRYYENDSLIGEPQEVKTGEAYTLKTFEQKQGYKGNWVIKGTDTVYTQTSANYDSITSLDLELSYVANTGTIKFFVYQEGRATGEMADQVAKTGDVINTSEFVAGKTEDNVYYNFIGYTTEKIDGVANPNPADIAIKVDENGNITETVLFEEDGQVITLYAVYALIYVG